MSCDCPIDLAGCSNKEEYYLAGPRPSDKSEIVSTMAFCHVHKYDLGQVPKETAEEIAAVFDYIGPCFVVAKASAWNEYIESKSAQKHGLLFLSI